MKIPLVPPPEWRLSLPPLLALLAESVVFLFAPLPLPEGVLERLLAGVGVLS
jgi:hypothetical protein